MDSYSTLLGAFFFTLVLLLGIATLTLGFQSAVYFHIRTDLLSYRES